MTCPSTLHHHSISSFLHHNTDVTHLLLTAYSTRATVLNLRATCRALRLLVEFQRFWLDSRLAPLPSFLPPPSTPFQGYLLRLNLAQLRLPAFLDSAALQVRTFAQIKPSDEPSPAIDLTPTLVRLVDSGECFPQTQVFFPSTPPTILFNALLAQPLAQLVLQHASSSIFLYGQSGAGKTHTAFALLPQAMQALLSCLPLLPPGASLSLRVTQIWKEHAQSLVSSSFSDLASGLALLNTTKQLRATSATRNNLESSRSHCVLELALQRGQASGASRLAVVDLAGSERFDSSVPRREAACINLGLLALTRCIHSLAARRKHVPWLDSRLTALLAPSLAGGRAASFVLCIDPGNRDESVHTLRFGKGAALVNLQPRLGPEQEDPSPPLDSLWAVRRRRDQVRSELALLESLWNDVLSRSTRAHDLPALPEHIPKYSRLSQELRELEQRVEQMVANSQQVF